MLMNRPARRLLLACFLLAVAAVPVRAQAPIVLEVDASEAPKKILHAHLTIPAKPGQLTLYYPKWIPGEHGPTGPITDLVGLKLTAGGKKVAWKRDEVDMFAIHCEVPEGADHLDVALDFLLATSKEGFTSAASASAKLAVISWNQVLLYPKGATIQEMQCRASLRLPSGWKLGTALPIDKQADALTTFSPVSLETLVDSPVLCGAYLRQTLLGPDGGPAHYLVMACDSEAGLEMTAEYRVKYDRLISEAGALFGARHYKSYRFLLALSDQLAHFGEEHHESSDNHAPERMFLDSETRLLYSTLLSHEYTHSWNGKYRRPVDMIVDDFQKPIRTRELWVYEGLTEYYGMVLAARSGLYTPEQFHDHLGVIVEWAKNQKGRSWRPLDDTAVAAQLLYQAPRGGQARRRGVDFYDEGVLLWLDADTLIREKTQGKKSLDDFCRRFHGGKGGAPAVKGYTFDDVVNDLSAVVEHDWKAFLTERLTATDAAPPLDGVKRGGWKLGYDDKPSDYLSAQESENKSIDLTTTLGLIVKEDGSVVDVIPDKPADKAGVAPGMKVVAVNTRRFSTQVLRTALAATKKSDAGVQLLVENGDYFQTYALAYKGGEKYPRLERDESVKTDLIGATIKPLTK
jgi:predicted metalloprotease with PDZ domain